MQSSGKHLLTMILKWKANSNWNLEMLVRETGVPGEKPS